MLTFYVCVVLQFPLCAIMNLIKTKGGEDNTEYHPISSFV